MLFRSDTTINGASIISLTTSAVPKLSDLAPLNSPHFTGTPTAPTQDASDNSARLATTAFVQSLLGLLMAAIPAGTPSGVVSAYAGDTAPSGWLLCNGSAVSRATYGALFAAIGTTFGAGNGTTTFNLPDLRGEFVRGLDGGRGVDLSRTLGSYQSDQVEAHKHVSAWGEAYADGANGVFGKTTSRGKRGSNATDTDNYWYHTNDGTDYDGSVNPVGVVGTETRPRNVAMNYIIKA